MFDVSDLYITNYFSRVSFVAKVWESVPWQTTFTTEKLEPQSAIPVKGESLTVLHTVSASELDGYNIYIIEQVT